MQQSIAIGKQFESNNKIIIIKLIMHFDSGIYPRNARWVQDLKINQYNPLHQKPRKEKGKKYDYFSRQRK